MTKYSFYFIALLSFIVQSCAAAPLRKVSCKDPSVQYMGRIKHEDSSATFYWSGTSATMRFTGSTIAVDLRDEKGTNYYYGIVDDSVYTKIKADTIRQSYTIADHLKKGVMHKVQVFKLTEESAGKSWLYGFETDGSTISLLDKVRKKIEFYGNSITAGYSVDDTVRDTGLPEYFNNYYTYAAMTARHYDAEYYNISKSGVGLMLSWFPVIMPELYDRLDPLDSIHKWNFHSYVPDLVVIDLFQNDSWLITKVNHPQFKNRFGTTPPDSTYIVNAYKQFVTTIRNTYPDASIVCTLGSMDATKDGSPWPGYVRAAVCQLHDRKVYSHIFAYKNATGHPKRKDQQKMAESLIQFIDANVQW
ncbi:electron transporter RnfD [Flavipsychrobacter stenotrophus]|uniref:Electron transporter RnfD n=1 Tax=Flavipsychrobacter stenotrophus TaxID=2077091 RepID=A0A2S7SRU7_9BACT|nr:SGNH/GDSL hydrolase family protein [Flavipsychrobacter stenotrophus]PQJ09438.1 electron transporter RnfD [Flavipsychrobacter stenotrophus]